MYRVMMIYVKTQFTGFHCWPGAPDDVAFLRNEHRHIFHVKLTVEVKHSDREIEFFQLKRWLDNYCDVNFKDRTFFSSCEMIAVHIMNAYDTQNPKNPSVSCEVSEDNENGALVFNLEDRK